MKNICTLSDVRVATVTLLAPFAVALLALLPQAGVAQNVSQRTPNLSNAWTPTRDVVQLNFTHRQFA